MNSTTAILLGSIVAASVFTAHAQERIEGKVTGTRLTVCTMQPGGCEGTLTLQSKNESITFKVPLGTAIMKGKDTIYLPALRGKTVAVTHVTEKGERIARGIEVTSP